jgi:ankyrin repeat protein
VDLADQFVETGCLCHDDPHFDHRSFHARAHQMLRENPWISEATIWSAAVAGNWRAVESFLHREPALLNGAGPYGWTPLFCACYSRVEPTDPTHSTFGVAKILLERGADPNTYTLKSNADERLSQEKRRFTALSGVFGGGSTGLANQPPHPRWRELSELLLAHGADAADEQALALNQDAALEILLRHGLNPEARGREGPTLMGRALALAARKGQVEQVRLLLGHGARADEKVQGKLAWEHAVAFGHMKAARILKEAGAATTTLSEVERFACACLAGDGQTARAMLQANPEMKQRAPKDMVHRAVSTRRIDAVKLALELGFDPNYQDDNPPITMTGQLAANYEIARLLIDHGASLKLRDPWYDSTGVGWADFFGQVALRDKLLDEAGICLLDALDFGRVDRVSEILAQDPAALERPFAECISRPPKPEDFQTPLVRMVARGNTEAVRCLLDSGADVNARHPDGRSLVEVASESGWHEITSMLERSQARH